MNRAHQFPASLPRSAKRHAGRTNAASTPLHIRADGVVADESLAQHVRDRAAREFGKLSYHVERVTVRLLDVNGPRGGKDVECRVKIVLSGAPSVVVAKRAAEARAAFDAAVAAAERALRRAVRGRGSRQKTRGKSRATKGRSVGRTPAYAPPPDGSLIDRRVGRSAEQLQRALDRPEKRRRDVPVDTAQPGRSATDRRAGYGSTARRNSKLRAPHAAVLLEDSAQDRPSRKSTRRSSGRSRPDNPLYLSRRRGLER